MPRAAKKPKDKNAPKRNQSSYFIFSNERRPALQAQQEGKISITEASKTISAEWKQMGEEQKKTYTEKAAAQKKEYLEKFAVYQRTDEYAQYQKKLQLWKETQKDLGRAASTSTNANANNKSKNKTKAPKKPKQPSDMPKRPQSSYFIFNNARRGALKEQNPDKKITELAKLIGAEWKIIPSAEKKEYIDQAKVLKDEYTIAIEEYKKTEGYAKYQEQLSEFKAAKKRFDDAQMNDMNNSDDHDMNAVPEKVSLPRKPKDAKCPKRPLTSFFVYSAAVRADVTKEFPESKKGSAMQKEIAKKWNLLSEEDKKPYNEQAGKLKEQYKLAMKEYEGTDAQIEFKQKLEEWKVECNKRRKDAKDKLHQQQQRQRQKQQQQEQRRSRYEESSDSDSDSSDSSSGSSSSDSSSGSYSSASSSDSSSDAGNKNNMNMNTSSYD